MLSESIWMSSSTRFPSEWDYCQHVIRWAMALPSWVLKNSKDGDPMAFGKPIKFHATYLEIFLMSGWNLPKCRLLPLATSFVSTKSGSIIFKFYSSSCRLQLALSLATTPPEKITSAPSASPSRSRTWEP